MPGPPEQYYRATVFIPFLDFVLNELQIRYLNHRSMLVMFRAFLPAQCCDAVFSDITNALDKYKLDLTLSTAQIESEFVQWQMKWRGVEDQRKPKSAIDSF